MRTDDKTLIERLGAIASIIIHRDDGETFVPYLKEAAQRLRELTQWQPIETAPKDGSVILTANYYGETSLVRWDGHDWVGLCDWFRVIESQGDFGTDYRYPFVTHWRPLPAPPTESEDA